MSSIRPIRFNLEAYVHKGIPSVPEVTVRYHANCVSELVLNIWRDRDHEPNKLLLDGCNFIFRKLMVALLVLHT